jgi:8-oxo-dGTP diphosphatase
MADPRHIVAVCGCFTNSRGEILLVRTPRRGWEFPGGQVEEGEGLIQALQREALEESGCEVEVGPLLAIYTNPAPPAKVIFMFQGWHQSGEPEGRDETLGAGWFTADRARECVANPPDALRLLDALAGGDRPVYRVYVTQPFREITARML